MTYQSRLATQERTRKNASKLFLLNLDEIFIAIQAFLLAHINVNLTCVICEGFDQMIAFLCSYLRQLNFPSHFCLPSVQRCSEFVLETFIKYLIDVSGRWRLCIVFGCKDDFVGHCWIHSVNADMLAIVNSNCLFQLQSQLPQDQAHRTSILALRNM